jgi:hypothetical protein
LELLARSPDGCPESLLRVEFDIDLAVSLGLVADGLAAIHQKRVKTRVPIVRLQITPAGREALGR